MFDKQKELLQLRKKAASMQKQLRAEIIEKEVGVVKVKVNGEQKIQSIDINAEKIEQDEIAELEGNIKAALEQAIDESQKIAAEKTKELMGGMGLPGM